MKIFPLNVTHLLYRRTWRVSYKHSIPFCTSWKFPWRNISPSVSFSSIFISSFTVTHKTHWRTLRVSQTFAFYISINYTIMTIIMTINVERGFSSFYFGTINSFFLCHEKKMVLCSWKSGREKWEWILQTFIVLKQKKTGNFAFCHLR